MRADDLDYESCSTTSIPNPSLYNPKNSVPKNLGDFDRLLLFCGKSISKSHHKSTDSSSGPSNDTTSPSSAPDDVPPELNLLDPHRAKIAGKEVRWKDEISLIGGRRKSTHGKVGDSDAPLFARLLKDDGYESDTEVSTNFRDQFTDSPALPLGQSVYSPTFSRRNRVVKTSFPSTPLQPSVVPPPFPAVNLDPSIIYPIYAVTIDEQKAKIINKMLEKFPGESDIVNSVSKLSNNSKDGIHIFVDCSNIVIGFYNRLKYNRKMSQVAYVKQPPISYHSLALVLERGRGVSRRVLIGKELCFPPHSLGSLLAQTEIRFQLPTLLPSKRQHTNSFLGSNPWPHSTGRGLPDYMREAAMYGYEVNMLERVSKLKRPTSKKKHGAGNGYATTSGPSSGSEAPFYGVPSVAEQAVDEVLQMKLLESMYNVS